MMLKSKKVTKKGSNTEDSWSMRGEFTSRHQEKPRLNLYNPDNVTFPIPSKCVDVIRRIQSSMNNVSEESMDDIWTEAKRVTLSEEWTGSARFQILCTRPL